MPRNHIQMLQIFFARFLQIVRDNIMLKNSGAAYRKRDKDFEQARTALTDGLRMQEVQDLEENSELKIDSPLITKRFYYPLLTLESTDRDYLLIPLRNSQIQWHRRVNFYTYGRLAKGIPTKVYYVPKSDFINQLYRYRSTSRPELQKSGVVQIPLLRIRMDSATIISSNEQPGNSRCLETSREVVYLSTDERRNVVLSMPFWVQEQQVSDVWRLKLTVGGDVAPTELVRWVVECCPSPIEIPEMSLQFRSQSHHLRNATRWHVDRAKVH